MALADADTGGIGIGIVRDPGRWEMWPGTGAMDNEASEGKTSAMIMYVEESEEMVEKGEEERGKGFQMN